MVLLLCLLLSLLLLVLYGKRIVVRTTVAKTPDSTVAGASAILLC